MVGSFRDRIGGLAAYAWRLPRDRDADTLALVYVDGVPLGGIARLHEVSQPAISAELARIGKRLAIVKAHPSLQMPAAKRSDVIAALCRAGATPQLAAFLWATYWTSSPALANEAHPVTNHRVALRRFLEEPAPRGVAAHLQRALRDLEAEGWGCLWGRQGRSTNQGSRGNRNPERALGTRRLR